MLRKAIEYIFGQVSDELFKEALKEAKNDVRENKKKFGERVDFKYVLKVMFIYLNMIHRYSNTD